MKTYTEYEQIIKGLIDANLIQSFGPNIDKNSILYLLKYGNEELDIVVYWKSDRQIVIEYFYQKIMQMNIEESYQNNQSPK